MSSAGTHRRGGVSLPISPSWDSKAYFSHWTLEPHWPIPLAPNFSDHEESGPPAYCEADRHHRRGAHLDHNGTVFLWGGELAVEEHCDNGCATAEQGGMHYEGPLTPSFLPSVFSYTTQRPLVEEIAGTSCQPGFAPCLLTCGLAPWPTLRACPGLDVTFPLPAAGPLPGAEQELPEGAHSRPVCAADL